MKTLQHLIIEAMYCSIGKCICTRYMLLRWLLYSFLVFIGEGVKYDDVSMIVINKSLRTAVQVIIDGG